VRSGVASARAHRRRGVECSRVTVVVFLRSLFKATRKTISDWNVKVQHPPSTCLPLGCFVHGARMPQNKLPVTPHRVNQASVCYKCGGTEVYDHRPIFNCDYCMRDVHQ
jgi:hypothetical protein